MTYFDERYIMRSMNMSRQNDSDLKKMAEIIDESPAATDLKNVARKYLDANRWLLNRWNLSAADAGFIGSEFVDEPERIFDEVKDLKKQYHEAMIENVKLRRQLKEEK